LALCKCNTQTWFSDFENELKQMTVPNLYSAIQKQEAIVKDKNSSKADKEVAVIFLIHLLGDLHQPFHVGRAEDQGGNLIPLTFLKNLPICTVFGIPNW
jgi:hypothetical protein